MAIRTLLTVTFLIGSTQGFFFNDGNNDSGNNPAAPTPTTSYPYHVTLDENYKLYWKFTDTHIIFETHVKTLGYVGFGISPNGGMKDSDIVIGWVANGNAHFSDRHATGQQMPVVDSSQDWTLASGYESGEYTVLAFVRKLDTCDTDDRPIMDGTTRVIYSYHPNDPTDENQIPYHGAESRGSKSVLLLDPPTADKNNPNLPSDITTLEFLNRNYSVPAKDTMYLCTVWKMPVLAEKHHMIRFEPVIQAGHEQLLHHVILYYCTGTTPESLVGTEYECYNNPPADLRNCEKVLISWAIGGEAFDYPPHVGYSLGTAQDPVYLRMETHYNNPEIRADFVDSSGLRLYLTKTLRQHDAGILEVGVSVNPFQVIPPYESSFISQGFCHQDCVDQALGDTEIKVFANLLHAHLLGRKLRTRHFRNGVELAPLQEDNNYDFNYQEQRMLHEERVIKKGDSLLVECDYDSSARTNPTFGGLSTMEEMCLSFLHYYPKIPFAVCLSRIEYNLSNDVPGKHVILILRDMNWSDAQVRQTFKEDMENSQIKIHCTGNDGPYPASQSQTDIPSHNKTLQRSETCQGPEDGATVYSLSLLVLSLCLYLSLS